MKRIAPLPLTVPLQEMHGSQIINLSVSEVLGPWKCVNRGTPYGMED